MLPFGVTIPAIVPQKSEIPEGLRNYPAFSGQFLFCFVSVIYNNSAYGTKLASKFL
jgi:hypothetical protein